LTFALNLFTKMPNEVRLTMMLFAVRYTFEFGPNILLRSLSPPQLFGSGPPDLTWPEGPVVIGDTAAKEEARRMILDFERRKEAESETLVAENELPLDAFPSPFN
jgi:hypothetical protein